MTNTATLLPQAIEFEHLDWQQLAPGIRVKVKTLTEKQIRLVEFGLEFVEPHWCQRSHTGFVLEGEIQIEFEDEVRTFCAGEGLFIPQDIPHRHYKTITPAILFLVEDSPAD